MAKRINEDISKSEMVFLDMARQTNNFFQI